jgi:hypothetical protein
MCSAQGWKPTGDKAALVKRIVEKQKALLRGRHGIVTLLEAKIGTKLGRDGPAGQLRSFYSANYQALDRFDRAWYEMRFRPHPLDWVSHFSWSLFHVAVINARAIWCAVHGRRVGIRDFLAGLVSSYVAALPP